MNFKNNPGNLRYSSKNQWLGQVEPRKGFCQFETMAAGFRAMIGTLISYREKNVLTLEAIINRYAPKTDGNDTEAYINHVVNRLNVFREWAPPDRIAYIQTAMAMIEVEQSAEGLREFNRWARTQTMETLIKICF